MASRDKITRHVCPRNCYDTCGMLAHTRNGKIINITGDPLHGYTKGKLCAKGYCYIRRVYSQERIKQPLRQLGRGTGRWQSISWDQALDIICEKILVLKDRYGSTLPICLNKYSGNFGLLNFAVEGLFNNLGPTTQVLGSPCWSAGLDAQYYDLGDNCNSDPENIQKAKLIILWGVNPSWTAVHSLPYIFKAQKNGAKVIVIDPVYSETAKKADWYIQINPGQDGALALALVSVIIKAGKEDKDFMRRNTLGWESFADYLRNIEIRELACRCGIELSVIKELADNISMLSPVFIWVGFGIQRYINGGQNIRIIDALGALTGNIGKEGGGVHFAGLSTWKLFNYNFLKTKHKNRFLNINNFASDILRAQNPPVKMLWISNRNIFRQDADLELLTKALSQIELVVSVEQFLNETTHYSDIVLPTTTFFEEMDIVPGYWHHWVGLNEQAIPPLYEARSDLEIAQCVSQKLNALSPGSCSFPEKGNYGDFLDKEFNKSTYQVLGITHWSELKNAPVKAKIPYVAWEDGKFRTPSGKYEFYSSEAQKAGFSALPVLKDPMPADEVYPIRLLNQHALHSLNSQFVNLDWIKAVNQESKLYVPPDIARAKNIVSGGTVRVFNSGGSVVVKAEVSNCIPPGTVLLDRGKDNINVKGIIRGVMTDMGKTATGNPGLAISENFVDIAAI